MMHCNGATVFKTDLCNIVSFVFFANALLIAYLCFMGCKKCSLSFVHELVCSC